MIQTRRANPISNCPLTAAIAAVGGKWKLVIVNCLVDSPRHFSALRNLMPDVSQKVLTEQLQELIADGLLERVPYRGVRLIALDDRDLTGAAGDSCEH